jgi:hypothetical protein
VDATNTPHISYYESRGQDLRFASNGATGWWIEKVDGAGNVGAWSALALDPQDHPRISYYDATNHALKFAYAGVTAVGPPSGPQSPLLAAGPTPFRDATQIHLKLPAPAARLRLVILDATGREVAALWDGAATTGILSLRWEPRTGGGDLPSGVYVIRATAENLNVTRRVLHVK